MKSSKSLAYGLRLLAAAMLCTGCEGESQRSAVAPGSLMNAAPVGVSALTARAKFEAFVGAQPRGAIHPDRGTSWNLAGCEERAQADVRVRLRT